jgi:hypothetical protein
MAITLDGTTGITTPGLTNTGTETIVNLTTTGNTILGDASTDTLNVGNGGLVKDASGNVGIGASAVAGYKLDIVGTTMRIAATAAGNGYETDAGATTLTTSFNRTTSTWLDHTYRANTHTFNTQGTTKMTLDASGNLLVGKTAVDATTAGTLISSQSSAFKGCIGVTMNANTNSDFGLFCYSTSAGNYRFYVGMGGNIYATATTITAISDERLKENVRELDYGLNEILTLQPRKFDWKEGQGLDKKDDVGFIAQEFETVFPNSVGLSKAGADGIEYKNINHSELIPTLVKAIQEQQAMIDELKAKVAALEAA